MRRDDFELESSNDERDWAYMHDFQIRDSDICAGYAFPRGTGLPRSGVSASQRGNEAQDYRGEMNVSGIGTVVPNHREHYWQERGGRYSPPRNTGGGWSREHHNPLMRESRGRTRHTPGREHETLRSIHRREEYEGEKERGQSRPRGGDPEGPGARKPYTPMLPGSGIRPRYTPRREPETPRGYGRTEEYEGERGPRGRGKSVSLPMSLKFDGKSNWKAFYAKFSRYAEVSEWTEEECRDQLCWCLDGKASEYYALLVERNHDMAYKDLILKIEKRFGFRKLPETAQVQFNNARQTPEELLED